MLFEITVSDKHFPDAPEQGRYSRRILRDRPLIKRAIVVRAERWYLEIADDDLDPLAHLRIFAELRAAAESEGLDLEIWTPSDAKTMNDLESRRAACLQPRPAHPDDLN